MLSTSVLSVALALSCSVSALSIPHLGDTFTRRSHHNIQARAQEARKEPPPGWAYSYLEDYNTYHIRYLALDCQDQHNTTFFDQCCHPLLASESLSSRPAQCTPSSSASSSASSVWSTMSVSVEATATDDDCSDEPESTSYVAASTTSSFEPTSSSAAPQTFAPVPTSTSDSWTESTTSSAKHHTSSSTPAPEPTTTWSSSAEPATTWSSSSVDPTTTWSSSADPTTTSSSSAEPTSTASSSGSDSGLTTGGIATFFYQNGVAGACGTINPESAVIAALQTETYAGGSNCGKQVEITRVSTGKTITVTVADECPTCNDPESIDLSIGAYIQLGTETEGEFDIAWKFL